MVTIAVNEAGRFTCVDGVLVSSIAASELDALFGMLERGDIEAVLVADRTETDEAPLIVSTMRERVA